MLRIVVLMLIITGVWSEVTLAQTPTREAAITCFDKAVQAYSQKEESQVRAHIASQIDLNSLAIRVANRGKISYDQALSLAKEAISGNRSTAFRDMDYQTVTFDRYTKVIKGPKQTRANPDPVIEVAGYYYRKGDKDRDDRENFTAILRIVGEDCQIVDLAYNNAWLSWAALN